MWRILCIAFAVFVAVSAGTVIKHGMQSATETLEIAGK